MILGLFLLGIGILVAIAVARSQGAFRGIGDAPEFQGKYTSLFETSSFVPCGQPDVRYWLVWGPNVDLTGELRKLGFEGLGAEAFLRFDGDLETGAPGGYGHLGLYSGQLTITKLATVSRESDCK